MIELKEITKKYGDFRAVDNLNLTVARGELFGFLGPNGAGKTTTIKMIAGILEPSAGTITIGGIDILKQPEAAKRKIGFIPDRPYLYEKLTGMEFLKFTADLYGVPNEIYRQNARKNLAMFSLTDWSDELIESYSHGMKQRLIMSAALLHDPEIIIVDEPMVGLDPAAIIMVKELFQNMARNGVSVFMSTHTLAVAEDVCDRVGIIHRGRLIACGTTADLRREANMTDTDLEKIFLNLTSTEN
jgi:ABC-2 type transport system ATP-binding protein